MSLTKFEKYLLSLKLVAFKIIRLTVFVSRRILQEKKSIILI